MPDDFKLERKDTLGKFQDAYEQKIIEMTQPEKIDELIRTIYQFGEDMFEVGADSQFYLDE